MSYEDISEAVAEQLKKSNKHVAIVGLFDRKQRGKTFSFFEGCKTQFTPKLYFGEVKQYIDKGEESEFSVKGVSIFPPHLVGEDSGELGVINEGSIDILLSSIKGGSAENLDPVDIGRVLFTKLKKSLDALQPYWNPHFDYQLLEGLALEIRSGNNPTEAKMSSTIKEAKMSSTIKEALYDIKLQPKILNYIKATKVEEEVFLNKLKEGKIEKYYKEIVSYKERLLSETNSLSNKEFFGDSSESFTRNTKLYPISHKEVASNSLVYMFQDFSENLGIVNSISHCQPLTSLIMNWAISEAVNHNEKAEKVERDTSNISEKFSEWFSTPSLDNKLVNEIEEDSGLVLDVIITDLDGKEDYQGKYKDLDNKKRISELFHILKNYHIASLVGKRKFGRKELETYLILSVERLLNLSSPELEENLKEGMDSLDRANAAIARMYQIFSEPNTKSVAWGDLVNIIKISEVTDAEEICKFLREFITDKEIFSKDSEDILSERKKEIILHFSKLCFESELKKSVDRDYSKIEEISKKYLVSSNAVRNHYQSKSEIVKSIPWVPREKVVDKITRKLQQEISFSANNADLGATKSEPKSDDLTPSSQSGNQKQPDQKVKEAETNNLVSLFNYEELFYSGSEAVKDVVAEPLIAAKNQIINANESSDTQSETKAEISAALNAVILMESMLSASDNTSKLHQLAPLILENQDTSLGTPILIHLVEELSKDFEGGIRNVPFGKYWQAGNWKDDDNEIAAKAKKQIEAWVTYWDMAGKGVIEAGKFLNVTKKINEIKAVAIGGDDTKLTIVNDTLDHYMESCNEENQPFYGHFPGDQTGDLNPPPQWIYLSDAAGSPISLGIQKVEKWYTNTFHSINLPLGLEERNLTTYPVFIGDLPATNLPTINFPNWGCIKFLLGGEADPLSMPDKKILTDLGVRVGSAATANTILAKLLVLSAEAVIYSKLITTLHFYVSQQEEGVKIHAKSVVFSTLKSLVEHNGLDCKLLSYIGNGGTAVSYTSEYKNFVASAAEVSIIWNEIAQDDLRDKYKAICEHVEQAKLMK